MSKSFGVPGESAGQQAEARRARLETMKRLEREGTNWEGGAAGEQLTADAISKHCPLAVALHDRRMPDSKANIDHLVVVPSGVWVIDSKRMKGRIRVEEGRNGSRKLVVNGEDRTSLVHKLTAQVTAVKTVLAGIDDRVPVYGGFCFWLPYEKSRELLNPFTPDTGLPLLKTWTIDGYPLFYWRPMVRRLNSAGTMTPAQAGRLGEVLAERFPTAVASSRADTWDRRAAGGPRTSPPPPADPSAAPPSEQAFPIAEAGRLSMEEFKAANAAEHQREWDEARSAIETALGMPAPGLLTDRLPQDGAVWCHPALWHARVYLACVHENVGETVPYANAASVVGAHHAGRAGAAQWRALTAFLEHLRDRGYIAFEAGADGRISDLTGLADLRSRPAS